MTASLWACATTFFPSPPLHHHPTHKLTANCYFRGSPAGPVSKANKTGSSLSWWTRRDESEAKHPLILTSLCLSVYSSIPPSQLSPPLFVFSSRGKLKPVGFVFLLLLAKCLFLKPRCWWIRSHLSEKHEVNHWVMWEEWSGVGGLTRLDFDVFLVFIFQTSWTVCQLPVRQSKTRSSVMT